MQQQGLLTICAVKKSGTKPKLDYNGNIYDQEFYVEETGDFESVIHQDLNENQIQALEITIKKPSKQAIHKAIEHLAQLKPISSSHIKQSTVISYLVYDLIDENISDFVVYEVCKKYRRSTESRFFPDNAEFLKQAKILMKKYKSAHEVLQKKENNEFFQEIRTIEKKEKFKNWQDFTPQEKIEQIEYLKTLSAPYNTIYQRAIGIPQDEIDKHIILGDPMGVGCV